MTDITKIRGYGRTCQRGHRVEGENVVTSGGYAKCRRCQNLSTRVPVSPEEGVECLICGDVLRTLTGHLRMHGITSREYKIRFPGSPIVGSIRRSIALDLFHDQLSAGRLKMPPRNRVCRKGHLIKTGNDGRRYCLKCRNEWRRKRYANDPEYRQKVLERSRERHSKIREEVNERKRSPEYRAKERERERERYANDREFREKKKALARERYRKKVEQ